MKRGKRAKLEQEKNRLIWWPSAQLKKQARVSDEKIYKEADKNPIDFWAKLAKQGITWFKPWTKTYEEKLPYFKWFLGAKTNACYNCIDRHLKNKAKANKTALIWIPEPTKEKPLKLTYKELYEQINRAANALKALGMKKGDVVAIYLPMIPEAIIAMLACARIGAIHSVVFSAFSAEALKTRLVDGKAKMLITADGYYRRGKLINLKASADQAIKGTQIKKVLVVKRASIPLKLSKKDLWWHEALKKEKPFCNPCYMDSEDILFLLYTSGCCHRNSLIQLANGEIRKISDIVENGIKNKIVNMHLNPFTQNYSNITHLHRYPNNSILYKIRTSSFEAAFTPNHRLFSLDESGNLIEKEINQINKGEKVFVVSKINISGEKQILPSLRSRKEPRSKTEFQPKKIPKIPKFLTPKFTQIIGYLTGDGHIDLRSIIFTDESLKNLKFYQELIEKELGIRGIIRQIERQRLLINSSILTNYVKEFFPECIVRSKNRSIPKIIQRSENECIASFLKGLFDAEGTIGHAFIKLSNTSEELVRASQLLLRRLGIFSVVYPAITKERIIRKRIIKETRFYNLHIYDRVSLNNFYKKINFSHEAKKLKLKKLIEKLSSRRVFPKERFPIFALLKEITKTIKIDWKNEFSKIVKYVYSNQIDRDGLILVKKFLDGKIKNKTTDDKKLEKLKLIRTKIQKLIEFEGVILEKVLEIKKINNDSDFIYDLTTRNHNYIANGFIVHNTTGKPKGIIHTTGGYLVQAYWTAKWDFDLHPGDIMWCTSDLGWITGHTYVCYAPLLNGITTLIYEGTPDYPDPGRLWQIIQKHKVNVFYTAPTALRMLMAQGNKWPKQYNLNSLKILGTVGEPIDEATWLWYFKTIGKEKCPIIDTWWQTETGGTLINALPGIGPFIPTVAGCSFPGTRHAVVDEKGKRAGAGEHGTLIQMSPFAPGMLRGVWKDPKRYKKTYWSQYKKFYFTSDGAYQDKEGNFRLTGRIDDVLKVAGHRLSTAELENTLDSHKAVDESAIVAKPDPIKGEVPVAFTILKKDIKPNAELETQLQEQIVKAIGPIAKIKEFYFVKDLPKTRSGKIIRRILKSLLKKEPLGDISTLQNPECVEELKKII